MTKRKRDTRQRSKWDQSKKHVAIYRYMYESDAYNALSLCARLALHELMYRYNGGNNGEIPLAARELARRLKVARNTAMKALRELESFGFAYPTVKGNYYARDKQATLWRITEYSYGSQGPTKDYLRRPRNGKTESRAQSVSRGGSISEPVKREIDAEGARTGAATEPVTPADADRTGSTVEPFSNLPYSQPYASTASSTASVREHGRWFGRWINIVRTRASLSQREVDRRAGQPYGICRALERGERDPGAHELAPLRQAYRAALREAVDADHGLTQAMKLNRMHPDTAR